jgi:hypothetical protein
LWGAVLSPTCLGFSSFSHVLDLGSFSTADTRAFCLLCPFYSVLWVHPDWMMARCGHYSDFPLKLLHIIFSQPQKLFWQSCADCYTAEYSKWALCFLPEFFICTAFFSVLLSFDLGLSWFCQILHPLISVSLADFSLCHSLETVMTGSCNIGDFILHCLHCLRYIILKFFVSYIFRGFGFRCLRYDYYCFSKLHRISSKRASEFCRSDGMLFLLYLINSYSLFISQCGCLFFGTIPVGPL